MPSRDHARDLVDEVERVLRDTVPDLLGPPWQNPDGGLGRVPGMASDLWSTAEILILVERVSATIARLVEPDAVARLRDYVLAAQHADHGWGADGDTSDVVGTALALMALRPMKDDVAVRALADQGVRWLARNQNQDGGWDVTPAGTGGNRVSTTYPTLHAYQAIGVWNLDNVGPIADVQQALNNARVWLTQVNTGSKLRESLPSRSPTIRHTAYAVLVDQSEQFTGGNLDLSRTDIQRWLEAEQHHDGMWGVGGSTSSAQPGDIESTAAALRALLQLGVAPANHRIRVAVDRLLRTQVSSRHLGQVYHGWPPTTSREATSWPTYYVLMALLDYLEATRGIRAGIGRIRFPRWRRYVSGGLLVTMLVAGAAGLMIAAGTVRWVAWALALVATLANILVAIPMVVDWSQRRRST